MHLILTGATRLVGTSVLHNMLAQENITRISILSRRPVKMAEGHTKANVFIHDDFNKYDQALLDELKDAHGCVWAQGVSQNAVSKEQYVQVTYEYPLAAARAFSTLHPDSPFMFIHVSGEGATQSPGTFTPLYGRVKGQTESALLDFGKTKPMFRVYNVRPAVVDWSNHPEIHPFIPKQEMYKRVVMTPLNLLWKSVMTPTREMGKVMTELAMSRGERLEGPNAGMEGSLVSNILLRRMAGLRGAGSRTYFLSVSEIQRVQLAREWAYGRYALCRSHAHAFATCAFSYWPHPL